MEETRTKKEELINQMVVGEGGEAFCTKCVAWLCSKQKPDRFEPEDTLRRSKAVLEA